jgi:hypothetical protein
MEEIFLCTIGTGKRGKTMKDVYLRVDEFTRNGFKGADLVLTLEDEPASEGETVLSNLEASKGSLTIGSSIRLCRILSKHSGSISSAVVQMLKKRREEHAAAPA